MSMNTETMPIKKIPVLPNTAVSKRIYDVETVPESIPGLTTSSGVVNTTFDLVLERDPDTTQFVVNRPIWEMWRVDVRTIPQEEHIVEKYNLDDFIGILSDEEAEKIRKGINLFRKEFDDDLADRNKLLFGE